MRMSIVMKAHNLSGHPALNIIINNAIKDFWFLRLQSYCSYL